ncbi:unnamed protein product, partial [Symbiodinium sp. CCMP2456]
AAQRMNLQIFLPSILALEKTSLLISTKQLSLLPFGHIKLTLQISLRMITINVQYLREQLHHLGVQVAALQEARAPEDATFVSQTHVRFCTAKDSGGTWIDTSVDWCQARADHYGLMVQVYFQTQASPQKLKHYGSNTLRGLKTGFAWTQLSSRMKYKLSNRDGTWMDTVYPRQMVAEPLQFKGGSLFAIWKGKSSTSKCSAFRGILVSSTTGKAFHRAVRARSVGALGEFGHDMQIGGLPKFPVVIASHFVRLFQEGNQRRHRSYGLLFLDLREAFYRVVRPLLVGSQCGD